MPETDWLAERFEEHRPHLRAVAFRILGSGGDAEDAVQDAWIRVAQSDTDEIANLGGWLTTIVSRLALDKLRARKRRREVPIDVGSGSETSDVADPAGPEDYAVLADAVGAAMMMVLDNLLPAERVAFVLHDTFGVSFAQIGDVLDRSPNAAKQVASRARNKIRGIDPADRNPARERELVEAFLDAARNGDLSGLIALLDPDVVLQADPAAVEMGSAAEVRGVGDVAAIFNGRARGAETVLVDGRAGAAWIVKGSTRVVWDVTIDSGQIVHIDMLADPAHLSEIELTRPT